MSAAGSVTLTAVESAVMAWLAEHGGSPTLRDAVRSVRPVRRQHSPAGEFVTFEIPASHADDEPGGEALPQHGPSIVSPLLPHGADTILFVTESGLPEVLEIFTYGDAWPEDLDSFQLLPPNSGAAAHRGDTRPVRGTAGSGRPTRAARARKRWAVVILSGLACLAGLAGALTHSYRTAVRVADGLMEPALGEVFCYDTRLSWPGGYEAKLLPSWMISYDAMHGLAGGPIGFQIDLAGGVIAANPRNLLERIADQAKQDVGATGNPACGCSSYDRRLCGEPSPW